MSKAHDDENELEQFGDPGIASKNAKIAGWLWLTYIVLPIWGVITFFIFWNGSWGWMDRGYWHELQEAANTTVPHINYDNLPPPNSKQGS